MRNGDTDRNCFSPGFPLDVDFDFELIFHNGDMDRNCFSPGFPLDVDFDFELIFHLFHMIHSYISTIRIIQNLVFTVPYFFKKTFALSFPEQFDESLIGIRPGLCSTHES